MKTIKNKNFDEKQEKYQESKWKCKVAFFTATGLKVKPPKIANCDKFPGISSEDCDLLKLIRGFCNSQFLLP